MDPLLFGACYQAPDEPGIKACLIRSLQGQSNNSGWAEKIYTPDLTFLVTKEIFLTSTSLALAVSSQQFWTQKQQSGVPYRPPSNLWANVCGQ